VTRHRLARTDRWFHLVTAPADYADEAADVVRMLADHGVVLDIGLGAGGRGRNSP
jgi:hypothetical protein